MAAASDDAAGGDPPLRRSLAPGPIGRRRWLAEWVLAQTASEMGGGERSAEARRGEARCGGENPKRDITYISHQRRGEGEGKRPKKATAAAQEGRARGADGQVHEEVQGGHGGGVGRHGGHAGGWRPDEVEVGSGGGRDDDEGAGGVGGVHQEEEGAAADGGRGDYSP